MVTSTGQSYHILFHGMVKYLEVYNFLVTLNFFCNKHNSFLTFDGPQLYNSEALPFTYDQYVVIELADKLYNSVTVFVFV